MIVQERPQNIYLAEDSRIYQALHEVEKALPPINYGWANAINDDQFQYIISSFEGQPLLQLRLNLSNSSDEIISYDCLTGSLLTQLHLFDAGVDSRLVQTSELMNDGLFEVDFALVTDQGLVRPPPVYQMLDSRFDKMDLARLTTKTTSAQINRIDVGVSDLFRPLTGGMSLKNGKASQYVSMVKIMAEEQFHLYYSTIERDVLTGKQERYTHEGKIGKSEALGFTEDRIKDFRSSIRYQEGYVSLPPHPRMFQFRQIQRDKQAIMRLAKRFYLDYTGELIKAFQTTSSHSPLSPQ